MSKYQSFMAAFGESPKEDIERQMQELVNEQFIVSSSFAPQVYVEKEFGTLEFEKIEARVTHLIDSATGLRVGDDFKKITFRDLEYLPPMGGRFKFDDNIWIVYGTDNINSTTSACLVRRCNNTMNMLDRYGNIHQEPCCQNQRQRADHHRGSSPTHRKGEDLGGRVEVEIEKLVFRSPFFRFPPRHPVETILQSG